MSSVAACDMHISHVNTHANIFLNVKTEWKGTFSKFHRFLLIFKYYLLLFKPLILTRLLWFSNVLRDVNYTTKSLLSETAYRNCVIPSK